MTNHLSSSALQKIQEAEKRRQKKMLGVAIGALALSGVIVGGGFYLQRVRSARQFAHDDSTISDMKPAMQQARLERANDLRGKWEKWARAHKSDVTAMRRGDRAAYSRIISVAPRPSELAEYGVREKRGTGNVVPFSVSFMNLDPLRSNGSKSNTNVEMLDSFVRAREENFSKFRDLPVFQSMNSGSKTIRVWVSGRITEQQVVENPDRAPGKNAFVMREREITPAYSFDS